MTYILSGRSHLGRHLALVLTLVLLFQPFAGLGAQIEPVRPSLKEWQKTLDEVEKEIARPEIRDSYLLRARDRLAYLRLQARTVADAAARQAELLQADLNALGPPPGDGEPSEAPGVAAKRKSLNEQLAEAKGTVKETELFITHADRIADAVQVLRRTRLTERVLSRGVSPLAPSVWRKALPELAAVWQSAYTAVESRLARDASGEETLAIGWHLALGLVLAVVLAFPLRSGLIRRFGYVALEGEPTYLQRLGVAAFTGVVRSLLPSMAAGAVYAGLLYDEVLTEPAVEVARTALFALSALFFVSGFCRSALAPEEPEWRLVPIHDYGARTASRAITALAALFALDRVLGEIGSQFAFSVELLSIQKFVFGLAISAVLLALLRPRVWFADEQAELRQGWRRLRYFLAVLVGAIPITAMLGFVVLSRLLATQLVLTAGIWASVRPLRRIATQSVAHALSQTSAPGRRVRAGLELGDDGVEMLAFWLGGVVELLVILVGIVALLVLWGAAGKDLAAWLQSLFFGFTIGGIEISLAKILLALVLFAVFLAVTRMLQKTLEQRIFPRTRLDLGLRHSIRSAVGYVGFTLAAALGVSSLGIDLSNLAIIAGALSVGIGFGLQNIVNNFVSGLILLVERPIKVGDWVVVGEHQGYVRKISVRATEITTFDRASVFIPNSSLISGAVMNRTYADKVGRVVLPVGIAYEADPKKAGDLLQEIASTHPEVCRKPSPAVLFRGFGENALNLELVALVHDVDKVRAVTSDLCFSIHETFRREGIGIPHPQRDFKLSLDEVQMQRIFEGRGLGQGVRRREKRR